MKLYYCPTYSSFVFTDTTKLLFNERVVDTSGLVEELKLHAGLVSEKKEDIERIVDYYKAVKKYMYKNFYKDLAVYAKNIKVKDSYFNLRYPLWHDDNITIDNCTLTKNCRAALWYTSNCSINKSKLHGIKALRECKNIIVKDTSIDSPDLAGVVIMLV